MSSTPHCRFCRSNNLVDEHLVISESSYLLGSIDPARSAQAIIVPERHVETPFELTSQEWLAIGETLDGKKTPFYHGAQRYKGDISTRLRARL